MVDLGVCVEGIRRAIVYGKDILKSRREFTRNPKKGWFEKAWEKFIKRRD